MTEKQNQEVLFSAQQAHISNFIKALRELVAQKQSITAQELATAQSLLKLALAQSTRSEFGVVVTFEEVCGDD